MIFHFFFLKRNGNGKSLNSILNNLRNTFAEAVYESDRGSSYVSYPSSTQSLTAVNIAAECPHLENMGRSFALFMCS